MKGFAVTSVISFFCIFLGFQGGLTAKQPYCFQFTWMGPGITNESIGYLNSSSSCHDTYDNCVDPQVITHDGTLPDYSKLWETYNPDRIGCQLTSGFVCAKWTSYYDDKVEYTMHTCAKITVEGEAPMTSGCVTSVMNNSRTTEVCACRSYQNSTPCNLGHYPYNSITAIGLLIVFCLVLKCIT